jgi:Tfp pilus assembly protein PilO
MTGRDRMVLIVLATAGVLAAFWLGVVSPARKQAADLDAQIATATQQRDAAVQAQSTARAAQRSYSADLAAVARLGKAVPGTDDTASLVYQLQAAAGHAHVEFDSVQPGGGTAGAPAASTTTAQPAAGGLTPLPLSLSFTGSYFGLERFLRRVHSFTSVDGSTIRVRGRLLSVSQLSLALGSGGKLTASVSASAYEAADSRPAAATASAPGTGGAAAPGSNTASAPVAPTTSAAVTGVGR